MLKCARPACLVTLAAVTAVGVVSLGAPPAAESARDGHQNIALSITGESSGTSQIVIDDDGQKTFYTFVGNSGDQKSVDACTGGLTYFTEVSEFINKPYFPIHNYCGGAPIMSLELGDHVYINHFGDFEVVSQLDVGPGDTARQLASLPGAIYIQTCHDTGPLMRVLGIVRA